LSNHENKKIGLLLLAYTINFVPLTATLVATSCANKILLRFYCDEDDFWRNYNVSQRRGMFMVLELQNHFTKELVV